MNNSFQQEDLLASNPTNDEISVAVKANAISANIKFGVVSIIDGKIYRVLSNKSMIVHIEEVKAVIDELCAAGLVETAFLGKTSDGEYILRHRAFKHQIFHNEWTTEQRKAAALMVLQLQRVMMKYNLYLHDPHPMNVTFVGPKPIYFDFDSICQGAPNWVGWMKLFWMGRNPHQSWANLLGIKKASTNNAIYKYPDPASMFDESFISTIEAPSKSQGTQWSTYIQQIPTNMNFKNVDSYTGKYAAVSKMFLKHDLGDEVESVLDIGASHGAFSQCMLALGAKDVVAVDIDEPVIEEFYKKTVEQNLPVTCAYLDFMSYHEEFGVHRTTENGLKCDLVLCIALIHHLCYFRGVTFEELAKRLHRVTGKYLMLGWISNDDKYLNGITNQLGIDRKDYTVQNFQAVFGKYFEQIDRTVGMDLPSRNLYLFKRKVGEGSR